MSGQKADPSLEKELSELRKQYWNEKNRKDGTDIASHDPLNAKLDSLFAAADSLYARSDAMETGRWEQDGLDETRREKAIQWAKEGRNFWNMARAAGWDRKTQDKHHSAYKEAGGQNPANGNTKDAERDLPGSSTTEGRMDESRFDTLYESKEDIGGPDGDFVRFWVMPKNLDALKRQVRSEGYVIKYTGEFRAMSKPICVNAARKRR